MAVTMAFQRSAYFRQRRFCAGSSAGNNAGRFGIEDGSALDLTFGLPGRGDEGDFDLASPDVVIFLRGKTDGRRGGVGDVSREDDDLSVSSSDDSEESLSSSWLLVHFIGMLTPTSKRRVAVAHRQGSNGSGRQSPAPSGKPRRSLVPRSQPHVFHQIESLPHRTFSHVIKHQFRVVCAYENFLPRYRVRLKIPAGDQPPKVGPAEKNKDPGRHQ